MPIVNVNFVLKSGSPKWTVVPDPVPVPPGLQALTWNLTGGAEFASNGIVPGSPAWPGADPKKVTATQWKSPDNNTGAGTFKYTINVVFNGQPFQNDPQIENQPMGGKSGHHQGSDGRHGSGGAQEK